MLGRGSEMNYMTQALSPMVSYLRINSSITKGIRGGHGGHGFTNEDYKFKAQ